MREYILNISKSYYSGISMEQTYRTELHNLIRDILSELGYTYDVVQEVSMRKIYGSKKPDFIVLDKEEVIGAIETKSIKRKLSDKRYKNQISYYSERKPLILTNYNDFQLIVEDNLFFEVYGVLNGDIENSKEDLMTLVDKFIKMTF